MFCLRPCLIRQSNGKLIYADQYCLQTWKPPVGFWTYTWWHWLSIAEAAPAGGMSICSQSIFMEQPRLKLFFSRSGRELPKLLFIFIYGGFTTRSHPSLLLFSCSHPNGALMRIIGLFKNIRGGGENNCSHNQLWTLVPSEPAHLQRRLPLLKYFK